VAAFRRFLFRRVRQSTPVLAVCASVAFLCPPVTFGAEFSAKPKLTLGEEYDDNIFLTRNEKVSDFISRVSPSLTLLYQTQGWDLTLSDTFQWWYYAKEERGNYSNDGSLSSKLTVIENFLHFDVTDTYANVVINPRGPSTTTNLTVNRTDSNVLDATPYLKYEIDPTTAATAGGTYTNIWYRSGAGVNRQVYKGFLTLEHRISQRLKTALKGEYLADRPADSTPNDDQTAFSLSASYKLGQNTEIDGAAGYRWITFSEGPNHNAAEYAVSVTYHLSEREEVGAVGTTAIRIFQLQLGASQLFRFSVNEGIVEEITQQVTARWGKSLSVDGRIYHTREDYIQLDQTNDAVGGALGLTYTPDVRWAYSVAGSYEWDTYSPQDTKRKVYVASATAAYRLTRVATVSLTDYYTRSIGDIESDNYIDNVVALQLRITL
jgi:hypothetical protein